MSVDNPFGDMEELSDAAPDGYVPRDPEPGRVGANGEVIEQIYEPVGGQPSFDESPFSVAVTVLQTPQAYVTEFQILNPDGSVAFEETYLPVEAREMGEQMRGGDAAALAEKLGENATEVTGEYLLSGGRMCGTLSIGETAGMDALNAFQNGEITAREFMDEFSAGADEIFGPTE